ncbi:MAG: cache domain-containing protein [Proteobacteria bacterium]|nr:cache domain-containing protein [Pseudomonadota bacterium]
MRPSEENASGRLRFDIRAKLLGVIGLAAIGIAVVSAVLVTNQINNNIARRHAELQELVQTTVTLVDSFYKRAKSGEMSEADAKQSAIKVINKLRFNGDNYFWVNDLHPTMIVHPFRPDLNGKDLSAIKDPTGLPLFVEFARVAKASGSGFVDYMWPKPNVSTPVEKVSYVALFQPWGWVIGTGVYNDDLMADRNKAIWSAVAIGGIALMVVAGAIGLIVRNIVLRMTALRNVAVELSKNNFSIQVRTEERNDEIGDIERAMSSMVQSVSAVVIGVKQSSLEVANASGEIASATTDLSLRTEEQAASLEQTSAAMEQLAATVRKNAENAQLASRDAEATRDAASHGGVVAGRATEAMDRIEKSSHKISSIITVIDEIARQTNLLALNAAVEAARAGEAGRGFAVVASEVRSLAQRSSQAAQDIKGLISESTNLVKDGVDLVNLAGKSLKDIVKSVTEVSSIVAEIAHASAEQATGIDEVNRALAQMDQATQENSALVEENAATSKMLEHQAQNLDEQVSVFSLPGMVVRETHSDGSGNRPEYGRKEISGGARNAMRPRSDLAA